MEPFVNLETTLWVNKNDRVNIPGHTNSLQKHYSLKLFTPKGWEERRTLFFLKELYYKLFLLNKLNSQIAQEVF